ncbi:MAG: nucleotidyltransferase family protein [Lachnospiraceae bacterium]|jgi:molybdenum cofactor cytidylyltransferase|nr:nucleotidyltransferase family protein [Lachnospiraceae bacterium]
MFHCIYLAAGFSKRFGGNKLHAIISGQEMYRNVLGRLLEIEKSGHFDLDLTVVAQEGEIAERLREEQIPTAVNPDPSRGISSSLQTGIEFLQSEDKIREGDYLVFFVADQPGLKKETIEDFLTAAEYSQMPMACVAAEKEPGNPCAFRSDLVPELMKLQGDRGGKKILKEHPEEVCLFEDVLPEELQDFDFRKDLKPDQG